MRFEGPVEVCDVVTRDTYSIPHSEVKEAVARLQKYTPLQITFAIYRVSEEWERDREILRKNLGRVHSSERQRTHRDEMNVAELPEHISEKSEVYTDPLAQKVQALVNEGILKNPRVFGEFVARSKLKAHTVTSFLYGLRRTLREDTDPDRPHYRFRTLEYQLSAKKKTGTFSFKEKIELLIEIAESAETKKVPHSSIAENPNAP
ncbi:hypothetical protein K2X83_02180 [Patescibacteria group bacterium]|nr:hypothetical protein [Patescibacteria group bacterium]